MPNYLVAGAVALATLSCAGSATAATVTALFEGTVSGGEGVFAGQAGQTHNLEIVGQDDAAGTPIVGSAPILTSLALDPTNAVSFGVTAFGDATSYQLDSMEYSLPGSAQSRASTMVTAYVGNDVDRGGNLFDVIFIRGLFSDSMVSGAVEYLAVFDPSTLASSSLDEAIVAGLANATTLLDSAGVSVMGSTNGAIRGPISLTSISSVDTPPPPGGGGSTGGGGGSAGGGGGNGGTPMPAPVPLPAGAPLLIAGLGALAWLRRRR